ncbi:MAG: zinc ribbon domain-containing protein [Oscillospiraceae bacterium]|nr:zinc ribbon domain-containing protein [Oscillospiraceae bacterium]
MDRETERKAGRFLGIGGSIYGIVFMVIWCGICAAMGAWFMLIFGVPMLIFMVVRTVVIVRKTKEKPKEPWDLPPEPEKYAGSRSSGEGFCPYCGMRREEGFEYCPKCGRRLP